MTDAPILKTSSTLPGVHPELAAPIATPWNDARWRTLIGFESATTASSAHPAFADRENLTTGDEELEEEEAIAQENEDDAPQKTPAFKNPLYQAGVVGVVALAIFGTAGVVLNGVGGEQTTDSTPTAAPLDVPVVANPDNPATQETSGTLKTEVALGRQERELAALNQAASDRRSTPPKPSTSTQTQTDRPPAPVAIRQTTPPPPILHNAPPAPTPLPRTPAVAPASTPTPSPVDPDALWSRLARSGSYGQTPGDRTVMAMSSEADIQTVNPEATAAPPFNEQTTGTNPSPVEAGPVIPTPVLPQMATVPPELAPLDLMATTPVADSRTVPSDQAIQPAAEALSAQGSPRFLMAGSVAAGTLETPVVISNDRGETPLTQRAIITLNQPLLDADGFIAVPQGAKVLAVPTRNSSGEVIQLDAVSILHNQQEFAVPSGTLLISGAQGDPLEARRLRDPTRGQLGRDLLVVGSRALAGVGDELTRPDSTTIVTGNVNGSEFSSSSTSSGRNILGAALREGLGEVGDRIEARSNQTAEETRTNTWVIPRGQAVQVFVNHTMQIP